MLSTKQVRTKKRRSDQLVFGVVDVRKFKMRENNKV